MLSLLRRFSKSPVGLGIFGLIIVAFVVTLYEGKSALGTNAIGDGAVASVGGIAVTEAEVMRRVQNALDAARRDQPTLDMASFIAQGGVEQTVELLVNGRALELFAQQQGMVASKKLVDGEIASIPAFAGPTGVFDRTTFLNLIAARKLTEAQLREDFGREALTKALVLPASGAARMPAGLSARYAAVLLETRSGLVAAIPSEAFVDRTPPSDAALTAYYSRNLARYTVPERRAVRYAVFDRTRFAGKVAPSETDIAAAYASQRARYGASERRTLTQVIVPNRADATAITARIAKGVDLAEAARAVGRTPISVPATDAAGFAKLTSPAIATAAFATAKGAIAPIERSGLGYHVVRVDTVTTIAATPLAAVRQALAAELAQANEAKAIADYVAKIEDAAADNATFDELCKQFGLTATTTPPLTATGKVFDDAPFAPDAAVAAVLPDTFKAEVDDDPAIAPLPTVGAAPGAPAAGYILWKLDRVVPPAPQPLAKIRQIAATDLAIEQAAKAARVVADKVAAAVNAGTPLAQALSAIGKPLPPAAPVTASRLEIARAEKVPPPLALMFAIAERRARVLEIAGRRGWYVVYLDRITRSNSASAAGLVEATQQQLSQAAGSEYVDQFARAARLAVGARIDAAAVARVKRTLAGVGR